LVNVGFVKCDEFASDYDILFGDGKVAFAGNGKLGS
jgi:hypothetical protein